jgi:hypothetical protein
LDLGIIILGLIIGGIPLLGFIFWVVEKYKTAKKYDTLKPKLENLNAYKLQWDVDYYGRKGFEDLGRDLICKKDNVVEIVQCKYWAREKIIHEKHIYYLFGTTVEYFLESFEVKEDLKQLALFPGLIQKRNVTPKLITTIDVSPKTEQVAKVLGVVVEKIPFPSGHYPYPSVKCNVSRRTEEKIYHLPFDQQYDTTKIEEERLECYVETVDEAEALGFRHAYRHRWKGEASG